MAAEGCANGRRRFVGWAEPTGPARNGRPDDKLREAHADFCSVMRRSVMHGVGTARSRLCPPYG